MADDTTEYELEKIRSQIAQEMQMKEMLEQSAEELTFTVEELEMRLEANEGNEWKTRFETQEEMDVQLERQILQLENKVEETKQSLREAANMQQQDGSFYIDSLPDVNQETVEQLDKEKHSLVNQIRDLEWRLDQESKAYHKSNNERKYYQHQAIPKGGYHILSYRAADGATYRTPRASGGNIPDDQRILDPKKGPIRKTAGVKNLPSLEHE